MAHVRTIATHNGAPVKEAALTSDAGVTVSILSYGALVRDWTVPDRAGEARTVTLGFEDFAPYPTHSRSFGIIAGRIANRVRYGRFALDGRTYQLDINKPPHHIHGGREGLGVCQWSLEADGEEARLTHTSPDGHMGYPGTVAFEVRYRLSGHTLTITMAGVPDRPTPIALAQHSYYNLSGGGRIDDHRLTVAADRVCVVDADTVPTGELQDVAETAFDFRTLRRVGPTQLDNNFCLTGAAPAAVLETDDMVLTLTTDRPGVQVYSAFDMPDIPVPGLGGARYGPFSGIALEAQDWPDAVNHPHFPSVIRTPDNPYRQETAITIAPKTR
ncbi:MAG: aldose epimerase family protein [Pseudomonadota bacterium]